MQLTRVRFSNWQLRSIHLDLLEANAIPDPFVGRHEADLQWIHSKTWVYSTTFEAAAVREGERVDIVFEGLDTFATVRLNGEEILKYALLIPRRTPIRANHL